MARLCGLIFLGAEWGAEHLFFRSYVHDAEMAVNLNTAPATKT